MKDGCVSVAAAIAEMPPPHLAPADCNVSALLWLMINTTDLR